MTFPSKKQKMVLQSRKKVILIEAGAGAGKSETVSEKAVIEAEQLMKNMESRSKTYSPTVLILSHTKYACDNIMRRIDNIITDATIRRMIQIMTFHSLSFRLINKISQSKYVIKKDINKTIIDDIFIEKDLLPKNSKIKKKVILSIIEDSKTYGTSIKKTIKRHYPDEQKNRKAIVRIWKEIKERKEKDGLITIDESPSVFVDLFNRGIIPPSSLTIPSVLIIDELQDILPNQWEIIKILSSSKTRVIAAGDPHQAIYTWAGASEKTFHRFRQNFTNCGEYQLTENYRSSIQNEQFCESIRSQSKIESRLESEGTFNGPKPIICCNKSKDVLGDFIASEICDLNNSGLSFGNILILYRHHKDKGSLIGPFNRNGIPYCVFEKNQRKVIPLVELIFAVHCVLENFNVTAPDSKVWHAWKILLNQVNNIGEQTIKKITLWLQARDISDETSYPGKTKAALQFNSFMAELERLKVQVKRPIDSTEYLETIILFLNTMQITSHSRTNRELASLFYLCGKFDSFNDVIQRYNDSSYPTFYPAGRKRPPFPKNYVTFSTIHKIKGSGFNTVFYIGTDDFLYEKHRSFDGENKSHEILLMNVACSRAKKRLYLLFPIGFEDWKRDIEAYNAWKIIRKLPDHLYNLRKLKS